jgi:hypothetical protein
MVLCPCCKSYDGDNIGLHWSNNPNCSSPEPSKYKKEIIKGLLMGDGTLNDVSGDSPFMQVNMINREFLEWVSDELGVFGLDVRMHKDSEEQFRLSSENFDNLKKSNFNDIYSLQTRCFDWMKDFRSWYTDSGKTFPKDLSLTSISAKVWYVCDGSVHYYTDSSNAHIQISASNERNNYDNINRMWNEVGFDVRLGESSSNFRFTVSESEDVLEWFGEPLPGFEHKWVIRDKNKYNSVK